MTEHQFKSANPAAQGAKAHSGPDKQAPKNGGQPWAFFAIDNLPEAMQAQSAAWFNGQADLFAGMQDMMAERMKRCQDGASFALQSFQRLCGSRNGADALSAYQEWMTGAMTFFMADLTALQDQSARMTQMNQSTLHALSPSKSAAAA
jgi:hypothetical protein